MATASPRLYLHHGYTLYLPWSHPILTYLHHFEQENEQVVPSFITSLIQLIEQQLGDAQDTAPIAAVRAHYQNTRRALAEKKERSERFQEIEP